MNRLSLIRITLLLGMMLPGLAFSGGRGGSSDGAGGGTFVLKPGKKNLIFWDLWQDYQDFEDKMAGEKMSLSPAGLAAHGEWVDSRKLRAHALLAKALVSKYKKDELENLRSWLEEVGANEIPLIFTDLPIAKISELAVPDYFQPDDTAGVKSIAGAYFDGRTNRIFININIWNRAGLKSQAALLFHERLRALQPYFVLSNNELQNAVAEVIDTEAPEKDYWKNDVGNWFGPNRLLSEIRRLPPSPASGSRSPIPAAKEIQEARAAGILGGPGTPSSVISVGQKNALEQMNINVFFDPLRCVQSLREIGQSDGSNFRCQTDGSLGGKGRLFPNINDRDFVVDFEIPMANGKSKFAFEANYYHYHVEKVLRNGDERLQQVKDREQSQRVDFETDGEIVRITLNGGEPVEIAKKNLLSSGDSRKIQLQFYPAENRIEVWSIYATSVVPVAKWSINLGDNNYDVDRFSFSMEEGTILRSFYREFKNMNGH